MPVQPDLPSSGRFISKPYTALHLNNALNELFAIATVRRN
jgi:hypothetical protein